MPGLHEAGKGVGVLLPTTATHRSPLFPAHLPVYNINNSPVPLPDCSFGALLNFVASSWYGDPCASMQWTVQGKAAGQPINLNRAMAARRKALAAATARKAARRSLA